MVNNIRISLYYRNCAAHIQQRWPLSVQTGLFFHQLCWILHLLASPSYCWKDKNRTAFGKLRSSEVKPYIFWWFVCPDQALASASISAVSCICLCAQYSEIEGEAPNLSNHSSIILRAFPAPQRGAESSLLIELVLCAQDRSRIMNSSLNNSYWGKLICFGVWQMRRVLSPASLFSPYDWCMTWNIHGRHGFQSHLL